MINRVLIIVFMLITVGAFSEKIPELVLTTENWKPFQYMVNGKIKGISVDVMDLMLKDLGSEQNRNHIKIIPWSRAYNSALKNDNTVLFLTAKTKDRENLFKWVGPLLKYNTYLISRKDNNIVLSDIKDLGKYKIGSVKDDASELFLQELGVPLNKMVRGSKGYDVVNILDKGRIDILLSEWTSFVSDVEHLKLNIDDFEPIYLASKSELYYAFSSTTSDDIINKFQKSFDNLEGLGTINYIFEQYGEHVSHVDFIK